jgi:prepilin-type N-terminal cleavage/methylation domain-containing protein
MSTAPPKSFQELTDPMNTTIRPSRQRGFTLIELLVVLAIITVLGSIAYPVITTLQANAHMATAMKRMEGLGSALKTYVSQNDGYLPAEDTTGPDDWAAVRKPEAQNTWYNALLRILNEKSPADYANMNRTADFFRKESFLYLPGARYPESGRNVRPYFAIAFNTKLHRKTRSEQGSDPKKPDLKMAGIQQPSRTILFLEQGLPGEAAAHPSISANSDYDGSCKASAKSFVTRYRTKGVLAFADGHAEPVTANDLLTPTGAIQWDATSAANQSLKYIWTPDPMEDPN